MVMNHFEMDEFLFELLRSRSPTGTEREAADIVEKYIGGVADVSRDVLGNRIAAFGGGDRTLMLAGHMDEIGFIVSYIDDDGFIFFEQLGGHDNIMLSGRRVAIMTKNGYVYGVTGKRAVHLMDAKERKEVPETHQVWIDIGVSSADEARALVSIGDPVVYDTVVRKLKEIPGVKKYVAVDGGMFDNPRYALYQAKYTALLANRAAEKATEIVSVAGKCCESGDIVCADVALPAAKSGDILAVLSTGAYNYSMASNYNRNFIPPVVLVKDGVAEYIVKPQTLEDLVRNDVIPDRLK